MLEHTNSGLHSMHRSNFWLLAPPDTVVPTKSDSDIIFCLKLLSKTLNCTPLLSLGESIDHLCINPIRSESIDHLCINPILRIGLIHK